MPTFKARTVCLILFLCSFLALSTDAPAASQTIIKIATIAPEGSTYDRVLQDLNKELQEKTNDRVKFKIYSGGVAGDEKGVLSKIRIGQLEGGAFTGFGMGEILPDVRILDLPFFFSSYEEFETVRHGLTPYYKNAFAEKGYILLGWIDLGSVYFYGVKPINNLAETRKTNVWVWEGDSLAQTCWQELGITPVPLSVIDVMMGLQTGIVDTVYNTPLGAVSFQWFVKTRFQTSTPIAFITATLLVKKNAFNKLSSDDQSIMLNLCEYHFSELKQLIKNQNKEATIVMTNRGVQPVIWPEADITELKKTADQVYRKLTGKQYSKHLFNQALRLRGSISVTQ